MAIISLKEIEKQHYYTHSSDIILEELYKLRGNNTRTKKVNKMDKMMPRKPEDNKKIYILYTVYSDEVEILDHYPTDDDISNFHRDTSSEYEDINVYEANRKGTISSIPNIKWDD